MPENNPNQFLSKKAYEISYALFRMAAVARRPSFADSMESRGLSLLDAAVAEDYEGARITARGIEYLLRFGADVGVLSQANVGIVVRELAVFNSAIAESQKSANILPNVELNGVFSKLPLPVAKKVADFQNEISESGSKDGELPLSSGHNSAVGCAGFTEEKPTNARGDSEGHNIVKSAMRQSAIFERIRQNGNLPDGRVGCRLKEIQEFLPETSERTLRYDIQNLIEKGLVERVGSGGPATYYKVKETAAMPESH